MPVVDIEPRHGRAVIAMSQNLQHYRERLRCSVRQVDDIFAGCMAEANRVFTPEGLERYLDGASTVCNLGRGQELVLIFLEGMPEVGRRCGEGVIPAVVESVRLLSATANAKAINPFLSTLPTVARRLPEAELLKEWLGLVEQMAREAAEGLLPLLKQVESLLGQLTIGGLVNWAEAGLKAHRAQPWRYADWFNLQGADTRAALQRERHGTLYMDYEQRIERYLRAFWDLEMECHPFSLAFDTLRRQVPHLDSRGFHIPDVYDDASGIRGIDRYRALLAHLAAHLAWTQPFIADNFNRFQQLAVETFEDARVEWLAMSRYPGLRTLWKALHPVPQEGACPEGWSCIRHQLAMVSRALLDPDHGYRDPVLLDFVERFRRRVEADPFDTKIASELGVAYVVATHETSFRSPKVYFDDTEVSYRDDNRYMWIFLEDTDDEDDFHSEHAAANPRSEEEEAQPLFVRHLREWDYTEGRHKPDWVTVQETIPPAGEAERMDELLDRNQRLASRLKRAIDLLKPQNYVRVRYQEDGDELDLDVAVRAMVDYRSGTTPDPRIHMSHRHNDRDIAVLILLDLSNSVNDVPEGAESSILELSQEAVAIMGWTLDALGDPFAVAGFASNTRHEVHYLHFKGFSESWNAEPKARLAAMEGGLSTRMGAALRTAGHYLGHRQNEKKLLLLLTDGEPHDVDVGDKDYLIEDTRQAVEELGGKGIATYCITLDPDADSYVEHIFGAGRFTVVDRIARLPERMTEVFMNLTRR